MPIIQKIFAYNTGSLISGTTQVGDLAISEANVEYSANFGGLQWWGGPDETNGYVICYPIPAGDRPTPVGILAYLGFKRSEAKTDNSFLELANSFVQGPPAPFSSATEASVWLTNNGYWNSFPASGVPANDLYYVVIPDGGLNAEVIVNFTGNTPSPSPTPTGTASVTPTPTGTSSVTPTPTGTASVTPTPTPSGTSSVTPTPTGTAVSGSLFEMVLFESGSDVIMSGTGQFNTTALSFSFNGNFQGLVRAGSALMHGGSGSAVISSDVYSGVTTYPSNFGVGGQFNANSGSGDSVGILGFGPGDYRLLVPPGYVSNTTVTTQSTFTGQTLSSLGCTPGTYTYSWGSGANAGTLSLQVVGVAPATPTPTPTNTSTPSNTPTETLPITPTPTETSTPTPTETLPVTPTPTETTTPTPTETLPVTPTPTPTGTPSAPSGSQYNFFVVEGQPAQAPTSSGNTEFFYNPGTLATYNPNYSGGTFLIYFNRYSSDGIDNLTAQQGLDTTGGTITMTQGANTVVYTGASGDYQVQSNFFFLQVTGASQQTIVSGGMFVSGSPIYVSFGTPAPSPTPSATSVTPTPTPTSGATGNFNVSISQVGLDVIWSGSGSFNLTDLLLDSSSSLGAGYAANSAIWAAGPAASVPTDQWSGPSFTTYPTSFGSGGSGSIGASSGSIFGILPGGSGRLLIVPLGYSSGNFISGSTTYTNSTISSLGLTPGTYTWSWGTGGNVSTMIMTITS